VAHALEARWTPAADGGPARFSKKYRDAQGIDDSKWTNDYSSSSAGWLPSLLPDTVGGWLLAAVCGVTIFILYQQAEVPGIRRGETIGGGAREAGPAGEAARAAFLKKYQQ